MKFTANHCLSAILASLGLASTAHAQGVSDNVVKIGVISDTSKIGRAHV